jgi:hypothetical protein
LKTVSRATSSRKGRVRIAVGFVFLLPFFLLLSLVAIGLRPEQLVEFEKPGRSLAKNWQSAVYLSSSSEPQRAVFPYSVIPGGVRDARELTAAVTDPVVARHYADFRLADAHTIRLERPTPMYVSYRIRDQVYWTRDRVLIPEGEALISDGQNLARERCGNRLSRSPRMPVLASEPTREQFEDVSFVPPLLADLDPLDSSDPAPQSLPELTWEPKLSSSAMGEPLIIPPPAGTGSAAPSPAAAPEPGSRTLLLEGALFCGLAFAFLRRNSGASVATEARARL